MSFDSSTLSALVGSRICHDLISPIGAINNGMELLAMTGVGHSPEMALISESVDAANARIRFFRIAFGATSDAHMLKRSEVMSIVRDMTRGTRTQVHWEPAEDLPRDEVQIAFLGIQCAEQAIPYGGQIDLRRIGQTWEIMTTAERFALDATLWARLTQPDCDTPDPVPAHVQFMLLPHAVAARGREIGYAVSDASIRLTL